MPLSFYFLAELLRPEQCNQSRFTHFLNAMFLSACWIVRGRTKKYNPQWKYVEEKAYVHVLYSVHTYMF